MTAALLAFVFAAPLDPQELLLRVAARYASFDHFLLEVRETRLPLDVAPLDSVRKRLAVAPGGRFFLDVRSEVPVSIVSDGETIHAGQPGSKTYYEEQFGGAAHQHVDAEIDNLVGRFALLDRVAASARFLRTAKVKTASGTIECAVLEISIGSPGKPGWRETLWIDPRRALVLRSDFQPSLATRLRIYREYLLPPSEETPGPALFVFKPRPGARPKPSPSAPSRPPDFPAIP